MDEFVKTRLRHLEPVLAGRKWLAVTFSVADIIMADVLRPVDWFDRLAGCPACRDYVARAAFRSSFVKAHADQMALLLRQIEQHRRQKLKSRETTP